MKKFNLAKVLKNEKGLDGVVITVILIVIAIIVLYVVFNPNGSSTDAGVVPKVQNISSQAIDTIEIPTGN